MLLLDGLCNGAETSKITGTSIEHNIVKGILNWVQVPVRCVWW